MTHKFCYRAKKTNLLPPPPTPPVPSPPVRAPQPASPVPNPLTILQANLILAMLVGFWGRAGDGPPGAQILVEGLSRLQMLVWFQDLCAPASRRRRRRGGPTLRGRPRLLED